MAEKDDFWEVNKLMLTYVHLRSNLPKALEEIFDRISKKQITALRKLDFTITPEEFEKINFDDVLESLAKDENTELLDDAFQKLLLLYFLCKKKNCPISKIIDPI